MFNFPLHHWHLEVSTKCMLKCPRCPRTFVKGHYKVGELALDDIKRIFSEKAFADNALKVTFCGGQGDPIYHSRFLEVIEFFKSFAKPKVLTIITNGSYKSREWWKDLRGLLREGDDVTFSVDGYDAASNQLYRVNSNWDSIMTGMETMAGGPAMVIWNAIYFRFNQNHIEQIYQMAVDRGLDGFRLTKSALFGSKYPEYNDPELGYDPLEPTTDKVSDNLRSFKTMEWLQPQSQRFLAYGQVLKGSGFNRIRAEYLQKTASDSRFPDFLPNCLFGFRGNYVDVEGYFYPCSWVSHPKKQLPDDAFRRTVLNLDMSKISLLERSLEEILRDPIWNDLLQAWSGAFEAAPYECRNHCRKSDFPSGEYERLLKIGGLSS